LASLPEPLQEMHAAYYRGQVYVAGGKLEATTLAGSPVGTAVEVRDLFFNVPARRKFLRGATTEFGHVQEQLARLALPHPDVEFEFNSGRRVVKHLPGCAGILERIGSFYGEQLVGDVVEVRRDERGLGINGYVAKPSHSRASGKWQYVFLNGRYIRDRFIQHAVREAYRGLMEPARYPVVFLMLAIDPTQVDVNVHPTKIEVRWQDSNVVYSQVLSCLREALLQSDLTPSLRADSSGSAVPAAERFEERKRIAEYFKQLTPSQSSFGGAPALSRLGFQRPPSMEKSEPATRSQSESPAERSAGDAREAGEPSPSPAIQLHRTYLVTETPEGILIIDQHALHERIIHEQLEGRLATESLEAQRLLIPETVALTPQQIAVLESHQELLDRIGVEITPYSDSSIAVLSFPSILQHLPISDFMTDLADRLREKGYQPHAEALIHEVVDMMACKAAVKAGDPLTPDEIRELIARRELADRRSSCPHGRPTTLRLTLADLERQFKRT